jgi:chorismate synthase
MNSFGRIFRIHIFGESHGPYVGVTIDGCPAGLPLSIDDFKDDLSRRRSGAPGTTERQEPDVPEIISGWHKGHTTGAPLAILFANKDVNPADYERFRDIPRPGHADFAATKKWRNHNDIRGGGYLSGRLTVALVAAGVIAKKLIAPVNVYATLVKAGGSYDIQEAIEEAVKEGDSIGGLIECCAQAVPSGWGEPFFDSVESLLSHLFFAIPGVKGVDFGVGFDAADMMKGSEFNDVIINATGQTKENNAGGITGGITNGNDLFMTVALRPPSSIKKAQQAFNIVSEKETTLQIVGRHDACFALRTPVIVEAAVAVVLADLMQISNSGYSI